MLAFSAPFFIVCASLLAPSLAAIADGETAAGGAGCTEPDTVSHRPLYEEFSATGIDRCTWDIVRANWGGQVNGKDYNGGVTPQNVVVRDGALALRALGDRYSGPLRGVDSSGAERKDGRRTGGAIRTWRRYRGGRFEARVRIADRLGVASAMWTFSHIETPKGEIRNHEIDIEFPGQADAKAPPSLEHVTLTAWTGLKPHESTTAFRKLPASMADGRFHHLQFDWRPPEDGKPGSVKFYIDGVLQSETRSNVPSDPGSFWLGVWFPPNWAGAPDFGETEMLVEWAKITPLSELPKE